MIYMPHDSVCGVENKNNTLAAGRTLNKRCELLEAAHKLHATKYCYNCVCVCACGLADNTALLLCR